MKPLSLLLVTCAVLVAGSVSAAPALKPADDLKKLQGDWVVTAWKQNGVALDQERLDTARWSVKGDKYTFEMGGNTEEGALKVDPAKKPAAIDLAITAGSDEGKGQVGVYQVDGDTVTFCFNRPGATDRPAGVAADAENGYILMTVKRVKKKDD